jgi:hypothetical protein
MNTNSKEKDKTQTTKPIAEKKEIEPVNEWIEPSLFDDYLIEELKKYLTDEHRPSSN